MLKPTRPLRCPICGSNVSFSIYRAVIRVEHWVQTAPLRFIRDSINPSKLDTSVAPLIVCAACAHPLGPIPAKAVVKVRVK
jgi:hypothetical protein